MGSMMGPVKGVTRGRGSTMGPVIGFAKSVTRGFSLGDT